MIAMVSVYVLFSLGKETRKQQKDCGNSLKCLILNMSAPIITPHTDRLYHSICMLKQNLKPLQSKD